MSGALAARNAPEAAERLKMRGRYPALIKASLRCYLQYPFLPIFKSAKGGEIGTKNLNGFGSTSDNWFLGQLRPIGRWHSGRPEGSPVNAYPSWIQRIPEMIEVLAMADAEHIDRRAAERLFDLRATAAKALLGRMGADLCGHSLVISRGLLMARLREAHENPDWRWEALCLRRIDVVL